MTASPSRNHPTITGSSSLPTATIAGPSRRKRIRTQTDQRRQQNRLAQRSHRDKKDREWTELHAEVQELRQKNAVLEVQVEELRRIIHASMGGRQISPTRQRVSHETQQSPSRRTSGAEAASSSPDALRRQIPIGSTSSSNVVPLVQPSSAIYVPAEVPPASSDIPTYAFQDPGLSSAVPDPGLPWSDNFLASLTERHERQPPSEAIPGVWSLPEQMTTANPEPYNVKSLDMMYGWDAGNVSLGCPDFSRLFDFNPTSKGSQSL